MPTTMMIVIRAFVRMRSMTDLGSAVAGYQAFLMCSFSVALG